MSAPFFIAIFVKTENVAKKARVKNIYYLCDRIVGGSFPMIREPSTLPIIFIAWETKTLG